MNWGKTFVRLNNIKKEKKLIFTNVKLSKIIRSLMLLTGVFVIGAYIGAYAEYISTYKPTEYVTEYKEVVKEREVVTDITEKIAKRVPHEGGWFDISISGMDDKIVIELTATNEIDGVVTKTRKKFRSIEELNKFVK